MKPRERATMAALLSVRADESHRAVQSERTSSGARDHAVGAGRVSIDNYADRPRSYPLSSAYWRRSDRATSLHLRASRTTGLTNTRESQLYYVQYVLLLYDVFII